jgi:hypothetical protein
MPFQLSTRRVLALALCPLTAGAVALSAAAPASAVSTPPTSSVSQASQSLTAPVSGTVNGVSQNGTLSITRFVRDANQILAVGNLSLGGQNLGTVQAPVAVTDPSGSCQILNLDLGPLDLNLLGLKVHLNEVVLNITAQQGAGNLLGNLLCAVAGLLDNNNALSGITALLNQILAAL